MGQQRQHHSLTVAPLQQQVQLLPVLLQASVVAARVVTVGLELAALSQDTLHSWSSSNNSSSNIRKASRLSMMTCTFTWPSVSRVGRRTNVCGCLCQTP